ncbi:Light-harvesting complex stress-related protein 1 [Durusdinium trenchii]|uniref:Chloroplastic (Chlorophyll a-b binding protein LHCSR1) n=1 Tax=Durusdinium trenchii TaxID=1381693 RepID=A0ABP0LX67_9DINO
MVLAACLRFARTDWPLHPLRGCAASRVQHARIFMGTNFVAILDASREVGDFGDPLGFQQLTFGSDLRDLRNRELNNGRFAMFATIGIVAAELATGKDAVEQLGFK